MKTLFFLLITFIFSTTMAYSTNTDLAESNDEYSLVQLVDDANTGLDSFELVEQTAVDPQDQLQAEAQRMLTRTSRARADADELIDTFLRTQYQLPLDPVPGLINSLSVDLTIHNLYQRRMRDSMPEHILDLEKRAIDKLRQIQAGTIKIQDKPDVGSGQIAVRVSNRQFGDDVLRRF